MNQAAPIAIAGSIPISRALKPTIAAPIAGETMSAALFTPSLTPMIAPRSSSGARRERTAVSVGSTIDAPMAQSTNTGKSHPSEVTK